MELTWGIAAIWLGLALVASLLSIRFKMSVALVEILVGIAAGNLALLLDHYHLFGLHWELKPNEWIAFLAGFGSILLTFMAGAEIEPALLRKYFKADFRHWICRFCRAIHRGNALRPFRERLGLERLPDLRNRAVHDLRGRGLCGDGRDGAERDGVGQDHPGRLLH